MKSVKKPRVITNLAPIIGRWKLDKGRATFLEPEKGQRTFGLCVSDARFSEGDVRVKVCNPKRKPNCRLLFGYRSPTSDYYLVGLGGHSAAYSLVHFNLSTGWRQIVVAGSEENLAEGRTYQMSVRVRGQRIILEVDGI